MSKVLTTTEGYNSVLGAISDSLDSVAGSKINTRGVKLGQVTKTQERTVFNAALTITLDKHDYAQFLGRDMDYLHIPTSGNYVFARVKPVVLDIISASFDNHAAPNGTAWKPITDSTRSWRVHHDPSYSPDSPILQASGSLKNAVDNWDRGRGRTSIVGANARMVISIEDLAKD